MPKSISNKAKRKKKSGHNTLQIKYILLASSKKINISTPTKFVPYAEGSDSYSGTFDLRFDGRAVVTGRRGRRRKKTLDNIKEMKGSWELKERYTVGQLVEALL